MIIHKILLSLLFFVTFSPDFEVSFAKAQNTKENILVFGGTSGTGLAAVKFLSKKNIPITVFVRPTSNLKNIRSFNVDFFIGDALNAKDVNAVFDSNAFTSVISSLGGRRGEPRPDLIGNNNITNAAKNYGVKRVVQISSIGAGENRIKPSSDANRMARVLYLKTLAEDYLISSDLDYTIIRPGGLERGSATGMGLLQEKPTTGSIDREELGRLVADVLIDKSSFGKVFFAIDPSLN